MVGHSCEVLGIAAGRVYIIDHAELQDGMQNHWSPSLIAQLVAPVVEQHHIGTVRASEPSSRP